jgi:hypothetical protein
MQPLLSSLSASDGLVQPLRKDSIVVLDGRIVFVQFYFDLLLLEYLFCLFSNANLDTWLAVHHSITFFISPSLAVAQDGHLQRVKIPEAAYVQFASLTS